MFSDKSSGDRPIRRRAGLAVAVAAAVVGGVLVPAGASLAGPSDDDVQAVVDRYAAGVHASYEASLASAIAMDDAIDAFVTDPTEETLGAAKDAWLAARDPEQAIQGQTIAFPSSLGAKAVDTVDPRIEAGWIESAAKKIRDAKGGSGDARLPVAITTRFISGGEDYTDTAIYDVGYRVDEGLLDSDVDLLGLSLVERGTAKNGQQKLDALWKRRSGT